jgi:hypothetical protein
LSTAVFALAFMRDLLMHRRELLHPDIYTVYYPFRAWFARRLAQGRLPLWNPYWGLGHPAEVWSSIPIDLYTLLEILLGPHYEWFMLVQALALLGVAAYSLRCLGATPWLAAAGAVLFFLSPWVSYFFVYFILGSSFIAHVLLFLFAYLWFETHQRRYLTLIAVATAFGMLGTKLDLWLVQCGHFILLTLAGAAVFHHKRLRDTALAATGAIGAMALGIATQAWQLAILLPTVSESGRAGNSGLVSILSARIYRELALSFSESVLVQLAIIGALLYAALAAGRRRAVVLTLMAVVSVIVCLTMNKRDLPSEPVADAPMASNAQYHTDPERSLLRTAPSSRDGTFAGFWYRFGSGPVSVGALLALGFVVVLLGDRHWRAHARSSILFLLFAYYYCRYTRGDLGEVMILDSAPVMFKLGLAAFVWLGCRQLADSRAARFAYVSVLCIFVIRDQGAILLAHISGFQWVPTRDNFVVDWAFVVLAIVGLTSLSRRREMSSPFGRQWTVPVAAFAVVVASILSSRGDLLHVHPLIGPAPPGYPYFQGIPSIRSLLAQLRDGPTTRVFFANDEFMEFHHMLGSSLLEGVGQVSLYSSLGSARYREWTILQRLGIRPEQGWRGWSNETTAGTVRRLPRVRDLGWPNSEIYKYTVINRPAFDRNVLALLGVRYALRLYPVEGPYHVEDAEPESLDDAVRRLDPRRVRLITGRFLSEPTKPMYLAELSRPLPRAFVLTIPRDEAEVALRRELQPRITPTEIIAATAQMPWRTARIARYEPERVEIDAETDGRSILVLSDLFHPFWRASVDGRPAEIFPVFSVLRGVRLEPGHHHVTFICEVPLLIAAWGVSAAALLMIVLGWTMTRRRPESSAGSGHR